MPRQVQHFIIDKITNSIESANTGESFETSIELILAGEIKHVHKKDGWHFNWKREFKEPGRQVYKLTVVNDDLIQGLISLQPIVDQLFIEMHLIESAPHNFGDDKQFLGVAGNLVAFACRTSFEMGFDGFVAFTAKTKLVNHYIATIGAQLIYGHDRMAIFPESAKNLVNSYYQNFFDDE